MNSFKKKDIYFLTLALIIIVTIFKGLVWIAILPLWHTPDEAAHFSTIQKYAENIDTTNSSKGFGASQELVFSEQLLETERGDDGITAFTYRPNYKIKYNSGTTGIYENEIKSIPHEFRKQPVYHEQAYYPPLYYQIGNLIYQSVYNSDIIVRAFAIRLFSIVTIVGITITAFFLAKEIFPKSKYLPLIFATITSFHPMLTFVSAGITSDNLANLFFSIFLLVAVYVIVRGLDYKKSILLGIVCGMGFFIKPQFIIAAGLASIVIFYQILRTRKFVFIFKNFVLFLIVIITFGGFIPIKEAFANLKESNQVLPYIETAVNESSQQELSFFEHFQNSIRQTIAQTLPWYWGVFKWLSLTLPRIVNQILMRLMLIGAIGLIVKIVIDIRKKDFNKVNQALFFLIFGAIIFYLAIIWRDWQHIRANGFPLGIQGRYFFPLILSHLSLLFIGLLALIPDKFKNATALLLGFGSIVLNYIALHTVFISTYNLNSFSSIINEISQYKPIYFKGNFLIVLFSIYLILTCLLLLALVKLCFKKVNEVNKV